MLIYKLVALQMLILEALCTVLFPILLIAYLINAKIISLFLLFNKVKSIFSM